MDILDRHISAHFPRKIALNNRNTTLCCETTSSAVLDLHRAVAHAGTLVFSPHFLCCSYLFNGILVSNDSGLEFLKTNFTSLLPLTQKSYLSKSS